MLSPQLFCATCGAANNAQDAQCFACGQPLQQSAASALTTNRLLKQRYHLLNPLAQGGMGSVYKAEDTELGNRIVAVKELSQKGLNQQESSEATDAFKHEALLLAGLMHPNLPRIYDHFLEAGRWYLVLDYIEGETLEEYLQKNGNRLTLKEVLEIGIQLCTVLDYLHTHQPPIIFRDLKPLNVMRTSNQQLYLIDFGIARFFKPGQARDTIAFGSPGYAAPEQYGKAQTSPSADIYSLGVMLHQMLTGSDPSTRPFFFAPLPAKYFRLQTLLNQMLDLDASKRLSSAATVKQRLQAIIAQQGTLSNQRLPSSAFSTPTVTTPQPIPSLSRATTAQPVPSSPPPATPPQSPPPAPRIIRPQTVPSTQGKFRCVYTGHLDIVTSLAWSPDGRSIASASYDKTVQLWDSASGKMQALYRGHERKWKSNHVNSVAWSPDGKSLASASDDRFIQLWRVIQLWGTSSTHTILTYNEHKTMITTVTWSPDGRFIASAGANAVHLWDPISGKTLDSYERDGAFFQTVDWSPNSGSIAVGDRRGIVHVLEVTNQTLQRKLMYADHNKSVEKVAWSPNGRYVASASEDKTVQIWEASTGKHVLTYRGHNGTVCALSWSLDSKQIVSAGEDGNIQIWETHSKRVMYTHPSHNSTVRAVAWSPDDQYIASSAHSRVYVWQAC